MWHVWKTAEMPIGFWWGNPRERDHLKDLGIDMRIIFKWIIKKWDGGHGLDWSGSGQGQVTTLVHAVMNLQVP
jgi:hypothetical protein